MAPLEPLPKRDGGMRIVPGARHQIGHQAIGLKFLRALDSGLGQAMPERIVGEFVTQDRGEVVGRRRERRQSGR